MLDDRIAIVLIHTDFDGNVLWKKNYSKKHGSLYPGISGSFVKTFDGGFVLGGSVSDTTAKSDGLIMRFNSTGDTLWTKIFGGPEFDVFYQCKQTLDGGFVSFGQTKSFGDINGDYYLVKTDSLGNFQWQKTYGGFRKEIGRYFDFTVDDGFILAGDSESYGLGGSDGYFVKTNSAGHVDWDKTYGTTKDDYARNVTTTWNGNFLQWGSLDTSINMGDFYFVPFVAKLDQNGEVLWRSFFNSPQPNFIYQLRELDDGTIVFTGEKRINQYNSDGGWIVKLDQLGYIIWERYYSYLKHPGAYRWGSTFYGDFQPTLDGGFIVTGNSWDTANGSSTAYQDIWLLKLNSQGCLTNDCGVAVGIDKPQVSIQPATIFTYPNPFQDQALISIRSKENLSKPFHFNLHNLAGQLIYSRKDQLNEYGYDEFYLEGFGLTPGIYVYSVISECGLLGRGKIVKR